MWIPGTLIDMWEVASHIIDKNIAVVGSIEKQCINKIQDGQMVKKALDKK